MKKRSTDEIIVLALCGLCMMGLALFAIIRIQRGDLAIAALDSIGFFAAVGLFFYVFRTQNLTFAGPALALLSLTGSVILIILGGPEERYLLYPTTIIAFFLMPATWALSASILSVLIASIFMLPALEVFDYGKFLLSISGCFLFSYIFARERNSQRDELMSLSTRDPLTGVGNRRAFDEQMEELLKIQERTPGTINLLLLDLDNFKAVNDDQGHDVGDHLLKEVATIISARVRAGDHAYRFGGDEFALLVQGAGASNLASDLCSRISEFAISEKLPVTASIGVAQLETKETAAEWIKNADKALYRAKQTGKNQVSVHTKAPEQIQATGR